MFVQVERPGLIAALLVVAAIPESAALAKGDFPTAEGVIVPADRPDQMIVGTNFGVVISEDAGRTWTWTCGQEPDVAAALYQLGPAPRRRLFAQTTQLWYSDDAGCSWQAAQTSLAGIVGGYVLVDPANADRVLSTAITQLADGGFSNELVLESATGGGSFEALRYAAADGVFVTGLSSPRTDPTTVYMTTGPAGAAALLRSSDGGVSWQPVDLGSAVGSGSLSLLAVDPSRSDQVFLRNVTASPATATGFTTTLVIVAGGGATISLPLTIPDGGLTSLLSMSDGTVLVAGDVTQGFATVPVLFRSEDGGGTFSQIEGAPHVHGIAERGGVVYAATDMYYDGFATAISADRGTTWQPGLMFPQIQAISACAKARCQEACANLVSEGVFPAAVCTADTTTTAADAGGDAAPPGDARPGTPPAPRGCGCGVAARQTARPEPLWLLVLSLTAARRRRRRDRRDGRGLA